MIVHDGSDALEPPATSASSLLIGSTGWFAADPLSCSFLGKLPLATIAMLAPGMVKMGPPASASVTFGMLPMYQKRKRS